MQINNEYRLHKTSFLCSYIMHATLPNDIIWVHVRHLLCTPLPLTPLTRSQYNTLPSYTFNLQSRDLEKNITEVRKKPFNLKSRDHVDTALLIPLNIKAILCRLASISHLVPYASCLFSTVINLIPAIRKMEGGGSIAQYRRRD